MNKDWDEPQPDPGRVHWPTVLAAAGVAALVASLILTIGIVGLSRNNSLSEPTVVVQGAETSETNAPDAEAPLPSPKEAGKGSTSAKPGSDRGAGAAGGASSGSNGVSGGSGAPQGAAGAGEPPTADTGGADAPALQGQGNQSAASAQSGPTDAGTELRWAPAEPIGEGYAVTSQDPTLDELNGIVFALTATDLSDETKAKNIEVPDAIIVPQTVSRVGLFRAPRGGSRLHGPIERNGDRLTVRLEAYSAGIPNVSMPITFVYTGGNWRLASESLCAGVRTVGLPIYCNA